MDMLPAVVFRFTCMEHVPQLDAGRQLVIRDPSRPFIFGHNVFVEPNLQPIQKGRENHAEAIHSGVRLANYGGLVDSDVLQLFGSPRQVPLHPLHDLIEITFWAILTPCWQWLNPILATQFIAGPDDDTDNPDLRAMGGFVRLQHFFCFGNVMLAFARA